MKDRENFNLWGTFIILFVSPHLISFTNLYLYYLNSMTIMLLFLKTLHKNFPVCFLIKLQHTKR